MRDIAHGAARGSGLGLVTDVISRFGKVEGPNGERLYSFNGNRVQRFLRKIVRGIFTIETSRFLPEESLVEVYLASARDPGLVLGSIPWFEAIRDTHPIARYGAVFDYKWVSTFDGALRGHGVAMMFWDGLIAATLFHDPTCGCESCRRRASEGVRNFVCEAYHEESICLADRSPRRHLLKS